MGHEQDLRELLVSVRLQSKINAWAAFFTGLSVAAQAVAIALAK
jgi:hypothetical protein